MLQKNRLQSFKTELPLKFINHHDNRTFKYQQID
jgi:hypothetical protein